MATKNYYYFVATLPSIKYGDAPPMSSAEFEAECYRRLSPKDAAFIHYCRYDPRLAVETVKPTGSPFIDQFLRFERIFLLNLAALRTDKLGRPPAADEPPADIPRTVAMAKNVFELDDPLEAALTIDRNRWGILNTMANMERLFKADSVYVHLLKIKLLERKQIFDSKEKGLEKFQERYGAIMDEYMHGTVPW